MGRAVIMRFYGDIFGVFTVFGDESGCSDACLRKGIFSIPKRAVITRKNAHSAQKESLTYKNDFGDDFGDRQST